MSGPAAGIRGAGDERAHRRGARAVPARGRESFATLLHTERPLQDKPHLSVLPQGIYAT